MPNNQCTIPRAQKKQALYLVTTARVTLSASTSLQTHSAIALLPVALLYVLVTKVRPAKLDLIGRFNHKVFARYLYLSGVNKAAWFDDPTWNTRQGFLYRFNFMNGNHVVSQ